MSENPHTEMALLFLDDSDGESRVSPYNMERAQIEATLALAWETARCADEARTANIIASLNPVEMSDGTTAKIQGDAAKRRLAQIKERIGAKE